MTSISRLCQAVVYCTQQVDLPEAKRGLRVVEEYLAEPDTCDEVYETVAQRIQSSLDQVPVLTKCFELLKKYLVQYPPQSPALLNRIAAACQQAALVEDNEFCGLEQCITYTRHLVKAALIQLGADPASMGNRLSSRDRDGERKGRSLGASLAIGANKKLRTPADPAKSALPPLAPEFADSAFLQRPHDLWTPASKESGSAAQASLATGSIHTKVSPETSGDLGRHQAAQGNGWLASPRSAELDSPLSGHLPLHAGDIPEDLLRCRWQRRPAATDTAGMARWHEALPRTSTSLFANAAEAVAAHVAAPTLRVHGDYRYDADCSIAVQLQAPGDVQLHLHTVARHQIDQASGRPKRRPAVSGDDAEQGKSPNLPTRPLFLYRPYTQQERLSMDLSETAAVVAIVLGPAAAASLLEPHHMELLEPDLLGNDAWSVPLGKRPQGQAMASILVKLLMDMWLELPTRESLPLVLSMLQASLEVGNASCRARVFDLLYNLSLHAHVMMPLDADADAADSEGTSPAAGSREHSDPAESLFDRSSEVASHDRRLPKRVASFQQWLRRILFQLLLDCAHLGEVTQEVWSAALGCLLHLVAREGTITGDTLAGLSPIAMTAMLRHVRAFGWSLELHSMLIRITCNLLYAEEPPVDEPLQAGASPRMRASGQLNMAALAAFGGAQHALRCLRCSPTRDARNNVLAVLLDAATELSALSKAERVRVCGFLSDERAAAALTIQLQACHKGFGETLAATVDAHLQAHGGSSPSVSAAGQLLKTLCRNLEVVVQPSLMDDELRALPDACLSPIAAERAAAWSTMGAVISSDNEDMQAVAVQLLTETLWRGRVDDVKLGTALRVQASKLGDSSAVKLGEAVLWHVSFLPGPDCTEHLPAEHPLRGFSTMMMAALLDAEACVAAANNLVHALHQLMARFLLYKDPQLAAVPDGVQVTTHHVAVVIATLQGAVDWIGLLKKPLRHVPLLWVSHLLLETLATRRVDADQENSAANKAFSNKLAETEPAAAAQSASSLSPITQLLQGLISVPSLAVMTLPPSMLLALFKHVAPVTSSQLLHVTPAMAAFQGWLAFASTPQHSGIGAAPPSAAPAHHGLAIGLASARDARLAAFLILLGRCRLDHATLHTIGGCSTLYHAMEDEDTRIRYVVADYIIDRLMRHKEAQFQAALAEVVGSAQNNNNNDNVVENPYAQLHAFVSRGLVTLEDL